MLKEVKPSSDSKMIKLLTFDNFDNRHYNILAKTRSSRMTTAITFSRQNDAVSRASTTKY